MGQPSGPLRDPEPRQQIRFCTTPTGVRVAYATIGRGPALLVPAAWIGHLELAWQDPSLRPRRTSPGCSAAPRRRRSPPSCWRSATRSRSSSRLTALPRRRWCCTGATTGRSLTALAVISPPGSGEHSWCRSRAATTSRMSATGAAVVRAILAFLGGSVSAPPPATSGRPEGLLTARQLQVAALVAEGFTNRQIAERLGIQERSAEGHLERIRQRLGVTSRAQIAAWWARGVQETEVSG